MLSVSMLRGYLYCKRKLYLQYVLKVFIDVPKIELTMGKIKHDFFNMISREESRIVQSVKTFLLYEDILELYKQNFLRLLRKAVIINKRALARLEVSLKEAYDDSKSLALDEAEYKAKSLFDFISENKVYGIDLWNKLPKLRSELEVQDGELNLKGFVDLVEFKGEEVRPVELKSGKVPIQGVWPADKVQLAAYCMLLERKYDKHIDKAVVRYMDSKEEREILINEFMRAEVNELIENTQNLMDSGDVPKLEVSPKCDYCELRSVCHNQIEVAKLNARVNMAKEESEQVK